MCVFLVKFMETGRRLQHKPRQKFKDNLKVNLNALHIDAQHWEELI